MDIHLKKQELRPCLITSAQKRLLLIIHLFIFKIVEPLKCLLLDKMGYVYVIL